MGLFILCASQGIILKVAMRKLDIKVAIDGTSGSGKSTTAKLVAKKLGLIPVDTGAMYRAITLKALRSGVSVHDEAAVVRMAEETEIDQRVIDGVIHTYLDGEDVSSEIRTPEVSKWVSVVSAYPGVRRRLVELQRKIAERGGVVLEGRDIGTVVLPDADFKFFMVASLEERARRRVNELREKGIHVEFEDVLKELKMRDTLDSSRKDSPLRKAPDAILIDTSNLTIDEQVELIINEIAKRYPEVLEIASEKGTRKGMETGEADS